MDVVPNPDGMWLASCDCALTCVCANQESAWNWLLDHPCVPMLADAGPLWRNDG